jgi:hypothetical protein
MAGAAVAGAAVAGAANKGASMGALFLCSVNAIGVAAGPQADVTTNTNTKTKKVAFRFVDISLLLEKNIKEWFSASISDSCNLFCHGLLSVP